MGLRRRRIPHIRLIGGTVCGSDGCGCVGGAGPLPLPLRASRSAGISDGPRLPCTATHRLWRCWPRVMTDEAGPTVISFDDLAARGRVTAGRLRDDVAHGRVDVRRGAAVASAIREGCGVDVIDVLLSAGASPHQRDAFGLPPLMVAHSRGSGPAVVALIACLCRAGADVHAADGTGAVPLHYAARLAEGALAPLLAAGADARRLTAKGETPLLLAVRHAASEAAALRLVDHQEAVERIDGAVAGAGATDGSGDDDASFAGATLQQWVSARDRDGACALTAAVLREASPHLAYRLVRAGADPLARFPPTAVLPAMQMALCASDTPTAAIGIAVSVEGEGEGSGEVEAAPHTMSRSRSASAGSTTSAVSAASGISIGVGTSGSGSVRSSTSSRDVVKPNVASTPSVWAYLCVPGTWTAVATSSSAAWRDPADGRPVAATPATSTATGASARPMSGIAVSRQRAKPRSTAWIDGWRGAVVAGLHDGAWLRRRTAVAMWRCGASAAAPRPSGGATPVAVTAAPLGSGMAGAAPSPSAAPGGSGRGVGAGVQCDRVTGTSAVVATAACEGL